LPPHTFHARPTTDFAKEALFDILSNYYAFNEISVLDLFSGTGSISYEFASRGSNSIDAIEMDPVHARFIRKMAEELNFNGLRVTQSDVFGFIKHTRNNYDVIFCDPPYDMNDIKTIPDLIFQRSLLKNGGMLIVEHSAMTSFAGNKNLFNTRKYGRVHFSFFAPSSSLPDGQNNSPEE